MANEQTQKLILEAPEDVVVFKLRPALKDGAAEKLQGRVKAGEKLATLTSTRLKWLRSRLDSAEEDLNIQDRFFVEVGGKSRRKDLEDVLNGQVKSAKDGVEAANDLLFIATHLLSIGALSKDGEAELQKQAAAVQMRLSEATQDYVTSLRKFEDLKSRIAIGRSRLQSENKIYEESTERLDIFSPTDGWFIASVGEGGFVMSGDPIGVVHRGVTKAKKQTLVCAAPDDVRVVSLKTKTLQCEVEGQQPIAVLSSNRIGQFKARLQAATGDLDVRKRFLTDPIIFRDGTKFSSQMEALKTILSEKVVSGNLAVVAAKSVMDAQETLFNVGLKWPYPNSCVAAWTMADAQFASATLDQQQFPNKVKDLQDRIESTSKRLKREEKILQELDGQMSLVAPIPAGSKALFVASVGAGAFVQRGDPIGVLHL